MSRKKARDSTQAFEKVLANPTLPHYVLRLFISGMTPQSMRVIANIKAICEENLQGRYALEVIDLRQQPELAQGEQLIAAPTLIKKLPLPLRRIIGDMSQTERVLVGLDLRVAPK